MHVDLTWDEDAGVLTSFRWNEADSCGDGVARDLTGATFLGELVGYFDDTVAYTIDPGNWAGGPSVPPPGGNVALMLEGGSLAGLAGLYRLRLYEDPTGLRNLFRRDDLPVVRINPAPST